MSDKITNMLFLCTGNSARSIIAEALLNHDGAGRFRAYSAGSHPKGAVHPGALTVLRGLGFDTATLRSKSWDEFAQPDAPTFDLVITVCDNAAGEVCPVWPGQPVVAHWGIPDPAAVEGDGQHQAFLDTVKYLRRRIELMLHLPISALESLALKRELTQIGRIEGATSATSADENA